MDSLVTNAEQALNNIRNFEMFLGESEEIQERLGYARAWYALRDGEGWLFGNSKIIGYRGLTPQKYLRGGFDGRQTEAILSKWFTEVPPSHPLHTELFEALSSFLSKFGKKPSALARISVWEDQDAASQQSRDDALVALILEVTKGLDTDRIKLIRSQLKALL